ncbi:WXG100 family type VII secretion target [Mycolicibacterium llatzerense]|uniref:WXG100 family type VII secretion target n=1 Tax=Mycolicibacterium llatzerense TaxID=280871 RepID=UPI0021B6DCF9|nr:WXG100 family type VII secretion target [Mycolicibacterium llatzerense]MCT7372137.1 hypothetical protein [Mycolicibacterium llatzerense]
MSEIVSYKDGVVQGVGSDMTNQGGQLHEIHQDTLQKTGALAEYFAGEGATGYFDAQHQMLAGLQGLAETVSTHGQTVHHIHNSAKETDRSMTRLFG